MIKFRFHRGSLEDSMKTVIEINTMVELVNAINKEFVYDIKETQITFSYASYDNRIGWDTYYVCVDGNAIGMSDGELAIKQNVTQEEELKIYRNLLIRLHEASWTGNAKMFSKIMNAISDYSYARTNSNPGNEEQEERDRLRTLLKLEKL